MNSMKKIEPPQNLTALAYDSIKAYILREDLDENTKLTEELLSKQLGISKSPVREALNTWIRTSGAYDAVVDFEAATRDPNNPKRIRADFDPGDHLHPNDAGYQAMANAVDLSLFGGKRTASKPAKR